MYGDVACFCELFDVTQSTFTALTCIFFAWLRHKFQVYLRDGLGEAGSANNFAGWLVWFIVIWVLVE